MSARKILALCPVLACAAAAGVPARLASWNLYYKALDDPLGRAAIISTLDSTGSGSGGGLYDFVATIEAAGDSPASAFPAWASGSAALGRLTPLSTASGYETLGLWYDAARWNATYVAKGEFESGRPWLLGHFAPKAKAEAEAEAEAKAEAAVAKNKGLWVVAVHLPHFLDSKVVCGQVLADALAAAAAASGTPTDNVVLAGDWNEFQWEDNPCAAPYYTPDCRTLAAARMAPLWGGGNVTGYFNGTARDVVPPSSTSCCTKWAAADRDTSGHAEWIFEFDHIFVAGAGVSVAGGGNGSYAAVMPYEYPGLAAPCADAACTGENPPRNTTATSQGSWHRGWVVDLVVN